MRIVLALLIVWVLYRILSGKPAIAVRLRPVQPSPQAELASVRRLQGMMSGTRCWQCKEEYVGLALDCACTNRGR